MQNQPRLKLKDLDVTFTSYPKRARRALSWDEFMRCAPRARSSGEIFQMLVDCLVPMGALTRDQAQQRIGLGMASTCALPLRSISDHGHGWPTSRRMPPALPASSDFWFG